MLVLLQENKEPAGMETIGKISPGQVYLWCDVREWGLEPGCQWPRSVLGVFEFCLLCSTENTVAGQVVCISDMSCGSLTGQTQKSLMAKQAAWAGDMPDNFGLPLNCFEGLHWIHW